MRFSRSSFVEGSSMRPSGHRCWTGSVLRRSRPVRMRACATPVRDPRRRTMRLRCSSACSGPRPDHTTRTRPSASACGRWERSRAFRLAPSHRWRRSASVRSRRPSSRGSTRTGGASMAPSGDNGMLRRAPRFLVSPCSMRDPRGARMRRSNAAGCSKSWIARKRRCRPIDRRCGWDRMEGRRWRRGASSWSVAIRRERRWRRPRCRKIRRWMPRPAIFWPATTGIKAVWSTRSAIGRGRRAWPPNPRSPGWSDPR